MVPAANSRATYCVLFHSFIFTLKLSKARIERINMNVPKSVIKLSKKGHLERWYLTDKNSVRIELLKSSN